MTFADVLRQMIESAMYSADITSASPLHVNHVSSIDINVGDFENIMRTAIEEMVDQKISELNTQAPPTTDIPEEAAGFKPLDVLQGAAKGTGGANAIKGQIFSMMPYIGQIMVATGVAMYLFEWARGAGGPLDKRYRRELMNESFNYMSRQLQRNTEIGNRQIIIQASANFKNLGGAGASNSLQQIRESGDRLANVGLLVTDTAHGLERLE